MRTAMAVGFVAALASASVGAADLFAQDAVRKWNYKREVYGSVGYGRFYHGDNFWGGGLEIGAGAGIRPFSGALRGVGLEVQLLRSGHFVRTSGAHSKEGTATSVAANGVYHFNNRRVQPFVFGGVGMLKADFTLRGISEWIDAQGHHLERTTERVDASKLAVGLGAGVKASIGRGFAIRPEVRFLDTTPGRGWNFGSIRFSIGVGYHF